ncbi:MAG TPA: hypothetical protein PKC19_17045, partial [Roseiflexaceae bacterium]|nr:hypothetical protein [Roseiflexaceae bacterium]
MQHARTVATALAGVLLLLSGWFFSGMHEPAAAGEAMAAAQKRIFLPMAGRSLSGGAPPATPVPQPPAAAGVFLSRMGDYHLNSSIAVDHAGGLHVAYTASGKTPDGVDPAYYSYCAAQAVNCADAANWQRVVLGSGAGDIQLLLSSNQSPRILISPTSGSRQPVAYRYAACNNSCGTAANWGIASVGITNDSGFGASRRLAQSFALDAQDRPRFVYIDYGAGGAEHTGTLLAYCDSGCTNSAGWSEILIDERTIGDLALQIDSQGLPHLLGSLLD